MANYSSLKSTVTNAVKQNGTNAITGALLQSVLISMINSLGAQFQFKGIATTGMNPGAPDYNVAYLGGPGTYENFSGLVIPSGCIGILKYNGTWSVETLYVGGGGGGSSVTWNQITTVGTKIAEITINGVTTDVLAPNAGGGGGYAPNEEDIDLNANNQLQFANRSSATGQLGYVILRSGSAISTQMAATNTIYEIRYNFDLNNGTLYVPAGSVLYFNGGSISNGTVVVDGNLVIGKDGCFRYVTLQVANGGGPIPGEGLASYFTGSSERAFKSLLAFSSARLTGDLTLTDLEVSISHNFVLDGDGHTITIVKGDDRGSGVTSYAFISVANGGYNVTVKNVNFVSRNAVFGADVTGSAFGYRGVVLQSNGNHITVENVTVDTTGTALTCWGNLANSGGFTILDSKFFSRMFDFEGQCEYIHAYNSTFSIKANDTFYYLCDVLSYYAIDSFFENCSIFGGIEVVPTTSTEATLIVSKCRIDDCFRIGTENDDVPISALIEDCIQSDFISNVNRNMGSKFRQWGGIKDVTFRNNELNISYYEDDQPYGIYFFIPYYAIKNLTFENNRFLQKAPSRYQVDSLIRIDTATERIKFDGNFISSNRNLKVLTVSSITATDIVGDNNLSSEGSPQYTVTIGGTQNDGVLYNLFPLRRSGVTANRPSLELFNVGFVYFDMSLNKPLYWDGYNWRYADGSLVV